MIVIYKRKGEYQGPNMTIGRGYTVIGIEADSYRLVNDSADPCLYDPSQFDVDDPREPAFWSTEFGTDGERYAYPPTWQRVGFFEDYHDGVVGVMDQFWRECGQLYNIHRNSRSPD